VRDSKRARGPRSTARLRGGLCVRAARRPMNTQERGPNSNEVELHRSIAPSAGRPSVSRDNRTMTSRPSSAPLADVSNVPGRGTTPMTNKDAMQVRAGPPVA